MEYTGDMENHYLSLYSFITAKANHVFRDSGFIRPDPWQSKGFIRSKIKVLYAEPLRLALYVLYVGTGWWAMSCDWMWLGANNGQRWHVRSFLWWAWRYSPMTAPTIRARICPLKAPVVDGRKGMDGWWWWGGDYVWERPQRLWIKRDR